MKYLPLTWTHAQKDSAFHLAMLATSYSAFGKARLVLTASKASTFMYLQAVNMIKQSLQDPVESCSDETLLATMVLSFYEVGDALYFARMILD